VIERARLEALAYGLLRIIAGGMFAFHGMQKIFGILASGGQPPVGSQAWIGGAIELVGGGLIALGILTRPAALLASGTMAVAYIQFHWKLAMGKALFPIVNGGELALLYCFVFLLFAIRGAGAAAVGPRGSWN
jgi:putative oxidoreductase